VESKERRELLMEKLKANAAPVTGAALAQAFGVSRQVVVGDIAILRAAGVDILATPQGYLIPSQLLKTQTQTATVACQHGWDKLAEELYVIVDNGGKIRDVIVEHPVYGELRGTLMLCSRREIEEFMDKLQNSGAAPLSAVTGGVHLHTIEVPSLAVLQRIEAELDNRGILFK
jgi:hypothetical protein